MSLDSFVSEMQHVLSKSHKEHWETLTLDFIAHEIRRTQRSLTEAVSRNKLDDITKYSVHLANFAYFMYERVETKDKRQL